jgi:hypothetical protein
MSQTATISLPNILQNWYITWYITTQTGNQVCVTLSDSSTTYINNTCIQGTSGKFTVLSTGNKQVSGAGLTLTIVDSTNATLQQVVNAYSITTPAGANAGAGYNVVLEDGSDNDFNDVFVSIVGWNAQG